MAINFPDSPSNNDIYTVNGKRWIYSSGKWSIYGSTAPDATASDTEPSGVGDGHIWYRSDQSQTLIRYDNTWVEVGSAGGFDNASTNFPTSLDSATGFAAVEALQAKVGVDSSAVTSSHDYKIADHASRITTLEALGTATAFTPTWQVGLTVGNATEEWYYIRIGDFVHVYGNTLLGSTSAVTGSLQMSYPVAREALSVQYQILGTATLFEAGVGYKLGAVYGLSTSLRLNPLISSGTYLAESNTAATVPFTWAAGDAIGATFTYKAA